MTEHGPIMNLQMQFHVISAQNFIYDDFCSTGAHGSAPLPETSSSGPASRLDISRLEKLAVHYFSKGLTDSTRRTYSSAQNRYMLLCRNAVL